MKGKLIFFLRNLAKMFAQNCILPIAYAVAKVRHPGKKALYVFADAHHVTIPFSLQKMYECVRRQGIEPVCHFYDYTREGALKSLLHAIMFMDIMAQAKYIFICNTFIPVSSGVKHKDTKVVQLCHYSGPFKKIGYATADDVPSYYSHNVFNNYDLVTASSEMFVPLLAQAMNQPKDVVQALGSSRSDVFFDNKWNQKCREEFYQRYPNARNMKVLLWAPTFRGKAAHPKALDNEAILQLQSTLGDEWLVLIKHHPHDDAMAYDDRYRSNCSIPTEKLLPIVDLLITDYSTTVLDYLAYDRPFILYAPDLEEYESIRGFFVDYRSITKNMTTDEAALPQMVKRVYEQWLSGDREEIANCRHTFTSACDGHATERILDYIHGMN